MKNWIDTKRMLLALIVLVTTGISYRQPAAASQPAAWPDIDLQLVQGSLSSPVHLAHAGDDSGRIFIVEQPGRIRILKDGALLPGAFLDIRDQVRSPAAGGGSEEGLLSVAFPPGYASKGHFYVYYTAKSGDNVVARFRRTSDPDKADPGSEEEILFLPHPQYTNHNGGQLAFGPDGYLYIGTGDGGGGGDPNENAQNTNSLLGKLLRIDVEPAVTPGTAKARLFLPLVRGGSGAQERPRYGIPASNPFRGRAGFRPEIWALGLRNPWRFSFDRQSGDLYIGDVGQSSHEEVDFQPASSPGGENYGWDIMEGPACYESGTCEQAGLVLPVVSYPTHQEGSCAVTGGFVYRGADHPVLQGIYFFADYCSGKIWGLRRVGGSWEHQELEDRDFLISSFGEDQDGELYVVSLGGQVYRLAAAAGQ